MVCERGLCHPTCHPQDPHRPPHTEHHFWKGCLVWGAVGRKEKADTRVGVGQAEENSDRWG